ncbi:MAG TPA: ABC transporter ATP-binding protein, partial [Ruminococcaceae bacterium]|nr:ABC transporter ATP-binding protein [Oscillospiraceae bacterium]
MKKQSPVGRIWELGANEHGKLITAVILAVIGVACGMAPYFAAAKIIVLLFGGEYTFSAYIPWLITALAGFILRTLLYNGALGISHTATFNILKTIRQKLLLKLPRLPLGTVIDTKSGKLKEIIVDQVDGMETTLAHLFPEMTANITAPLLTVIYLFILDWRLALLSLAVFPIAFIFMMTVMGNYAKDYEGAVKATTEMSGTVIEYINGIEVIKAFNQGKTSYTKLTDKVRANAQYYYDWMRRSQLGMSLAYAFFPAQMHTVLPFGWIFYTHGSLTAETFITVVILALGMAAPIVAAFNFVDTLAQVGTTVAQVDEILKAEEQSHAEKSVTFNGYGIELKNVSFGYNSDAEILHNVSLFIPQNSMTALVGPSGSGKSTIAKLIAGFWDVKNGVITMGGSDLKDIPLNELYDQVAFVTQDNYLFDDTVRENIRMGKKGATDAEVEAAAHNAGCDSFISGLENGYDTVVGGGGAHLSGGERQRI